MIWHDHGMTRTGQSGCGVRGDAANQGSCPRLLVLLSGMYVPVLRLISKRARSFIEPACCLDRWSWTDLASAAAHQVALNTGRIMATARSRWAIRQNVHPD